MDRSTRSAAVPPCEDGGVRVFLLGLSVVALLTATGLMVMSRLRTGTWSPPDLSQIRIPIQEVLSPAGPRVPRTIVLWRDGATVEGGHDASHLLRSSVVRNSGKERVVVPKFSGGDRRWKELVTCVRAQFAPFDVDVVEARPTQPGYVLALIGGSASVLGRGPKIGGLAPYSGAIVEDPVVFIFAKALANDVRTTCETTAMEIAHAYGLDHAYLCSDVMSYLKPCGRRKFQPKGVPCGEHAPRACGDGQPTQSSYDRLLTVLGAAR